MDDDDLKAMKVTQPSRLRNEEAEKLIRKINPGKGWDYNPGKSALEFDNDFGKFSLYQLQPTFKDNNRPSIEKLDDSYFIQQPDKFPSIKEIGKDNLWKLIEKEFDFKNNYAIIPTADNDLAIISKNRLNYLLTKSDNREQFIPFIKPALQDPFEVYLALYQSDKGFVEYRKHYIGLFKDKKKRSYFIVLRMEKDSTIFYNAFPYNLKDIDRVRKGKIIYTKKPR